MLFNSLQFFLFFPIVTVMYFLLPHKFRWFLLLAASCYFYMVFKPIYILILAVTIVVDYYAGLWIEGAQGTHRKWLLTLSVFVNVGFLAFFKYWNFINDNITHLLGFAHVENQLPYLEILLPIGLSFHTFQAMSYTIEVYRGNQKAEKHFGIYALYVMFYPQLVAGPIERPQNVLHQFHEEHSFNYTDFVEGLKRMLWGLFKKVVVADNLARFVDFCYDNPNDHSPMSLIFATVFFSAQIYCDFSGYSDIALGSAQSMGFKLMTNFKLPYISQNISEFWSRWHISLSTWFRDYLYIPLGGNRVKKSRWYMNLMIVFLVSGLWHGANYTFIIWGALHGLYLIVGILTADFQKKYLPRFAHHLFTIILVMFAWIFFRAKSFELSKQIITHSLDVIHLGMSGFTSDLSAFGPGIFLVLLFLLLVFFSIDQFVSKVLDHERTISANKSMILFASLMAMLLIFGFYGQTQFIYFQF